MTTTCAECNSVVAVNEYCGSCGKLLNQAINKFSQHIGIDGNNNDVVQSNAGRDVNINIVKPDKPQQEVNYDKVTRKTYTFKQLLIVPGIPAAIAILLQIYSFIGSSASIVSLTANADNPAGAALLNIILAIVFIVSTALAISALAWLAYIWFGGRPHIFMLDTFVEKKDDGLVHDIEFTTKCKTGKCDGTLRVRTAPPNDDGVSYIGVCNKNPQQHRYSFDKSLLTGEPINLKPKKETPQNNR